MALSGQEKRAVYDALLDTFNSTAELNTLVTFCLDMPLARIAHGNATLDTAVLDVIEWARARNKLKLLLLGLKDTAPENKLVRKALLTLQIDEGADGLEKAVFAHLDIADPDAWRADMIKAERAVCRIDTQYGEGVGTGFLISRDLVLTNSHVLSAIEEVGLDSRRAQMRFDYHRDGSLNVVTPGKVYKLDDKCPIVVRDQDLDIAIVRLEAPAGEEPINEQPTAPSRGYLRLTSHRFASGEPMCIIQHPKAEYRKFAYGSVFDRDVGEKHVAYKINTEPGSSGSPCFTHDWQLVAVHYFGLASDQFNRGIKASAIMTALGPTILAATS